MKQAGGGFRRCALACAGVLALVAHAWAREPVDFAGNYKWSGGTNDTQALAQEVARVADTLPLIIRPLARYRMSETFTPCEQISITVTNADIVFSQTNMTSIATRLGGEPVRWEREPGTFCLATFTRTDDGRLRQFLREADGTRETIFTLAPDGKEMTVDITIHSKRLDTPVHFLLHYRRAAP